MPSSILRLKGPSWGDSGVVSPSTTHSPTRSSTPISQPQPLRSISIRLGVDLDTILASWETQDKDKAIIRPSSALEDEDDDEYLASVVREVIKPKDLFNREKKSVKDLRKDMLHSNKAYQKTGRPIAENRGYQADNSLHDSRRRVAKAGYATKKAELPIHKGRMVDDVASCPSPLLPPEFEEFLESLDRENAEYRRTLQKG